jgi:RNA polymerase sigma-70 factor (ECF subfamily)
MQANPSSNRVSGGSEEPSIFDEPRLVRAVLAKERKATAQFVELCTDSVYGFVRRRVMPRAELVEDLMQDILVAAWQALPNFRQEASLRSWVLGIARHKVEDYYRKRICQTDLPEDDDGSQELAVLPAFEHQLDSAAQQDRVQKTLGDLPEIYALALMWRYRDEKSAREMAELTGKTEKAMERLLARARESFRGRWNYGRP